MPRILVTGYGGFLGAEVTRQLVNAGFDVKGVARNHYPDLEAVGAHTIQGDITNRGLLEDICHDCDAVIHTAAKAGVWGPWQEYYDINTQATLNLLEAAVQSQVSVFVYTSSPSVTFDGQHQSGVDESVGYPNQWLCSYPHTKALAEQAVLKAAASGEIHTCALRPHLVWGMDDPHLFPRVVERARQGRLRRVGSGTNLIDVVHVASAARAHVQAVQHLLDGDQAVNGEAFFLTDGKPVECWSWISRILEAAGVAVPQRSISFGAAYRIGQCLEWGYRAFQVQSEPPMTRFVAAQLALDHYFSIDKAKNRLGYQPAVNVDEEFERCKPWLQGLAAA